jgi:hypothetical protein
MTTQLMLFAEGREPRKPPVNSRAPEKRIDVSPKTCKCDGQLVEQDEHGTWCLRCGKRKVKK